MSDAKDEIGVDTPKPRRLEENDEVVVYLCSLDQRLSKEGTEGTDFEVLVQNVLSEIKSRAASAASDRRTHAIIEKIVLVATFAQLLELLNSISPYVLFLSRNRFASHILQLILAKTSHFLKEFGSSDVEFVEVLTRFMQPIVSELPWLIKDMCASHVVRACLSVLAGIPVLSERKGKSSRHQHSVSYTQTLDSILIPGSFHIDCKHSYAVPVEFHELLNSAMEILMKENLKSLHKLHADASSAAVLGLLIRMLYSPGLIPHGESIGERYVRRVLEMNDLQKSKHDGAITSPSVFYAMAGDRSASYFLEAVVEGCSESTLLELLRGNLVGKAIEYVDDSVGNFVVQAVLRRLSRSCAGGKCSEEMLKLSDDVLHELFASEKLVELLEKKGGVVLWMLELALALKERRSLHLKGKKHDNWMQALGRWVLGQWTGDGAAAFESVLSRRLAKSETSNETNAKTSDDRTVSAAKEVGGLDPARLLFSRLVGVLLRMAGTSVSKQVFTALCKLPPSALLESATVGPISKAFVDPIFTVFGPVSSPMHKDFIKLIKSTFANIAPALATHHVGQHVLRKAFECSDIDAKEALVASLLSEKDRLNRSKEGRNSLRLMHAELFERLPAEWRSQLRKQAQAQVMLMELEGSTEKKTDPVPSTKKPKLAITASGNSNLSAVDRSCMEDADDGEDVEDEVEDTKATEKTGRKRKRKRPNKSKGAAVDPSTTAVERSIPKDTPLENTQSKKVENDRVETVTSRGPFTSELKVDKAPTPASKDIPHTPTSGQNKEKREKTPHSGQKADLKKIRLLNSGKLLSSIHINKEIELLEKEKRRKPN